jgi:hypothetical protein
MLHSKVVRTRRVRLTVMALACVVAAVINAGAAGSSWYVATNGPAGGDGSSWALAWTNLQTAIDAATAGDTIYLAGHAFSYDTAQLGSHYVWTNKPLTILGGYAGIDGSPGALTDSPTILTAVTGGTSR